MSEALASRLDGIEMLVFSGFVVLGLLVTLVLAVLVFRRGPR